MMDWFSYAIAFTALVVFYYYWFFFPSWTKGFFAKFWRNPVASAVFLVAFLLLLNVLGFWDWTIWEWIEFDFIRPIAWIPLWSDWGVLAESMVSLSLSVWPLWVALGAFFVVLKR